MKCEKWTDQRDTSVDFFFVPRSFYADQFTFKRKKSTEIRF